MDQTERIQRIKELSEKKYDTTRELATGIERMIAFHRGRLIAATPGNQESILKLIESYEEMLALAKADLEGQETLRNAGGRHGAA